MIKTCRKGHTSERNTKLGKCPVCTSAYNKLWNERNPGVKHALTQAWKQKNPHRTHPRRNKPAPTRPRPETCDLCGKSHTSGRALHLDHCHETGKFRGWLCYGCNTSLGQLGDNSAGLNRALAYIESAVNAS